MIEVKKLEDFDALQLKLASPEEILKWSYGEVTKPETINYRTQRAEKDGLFCEKIFGPERDWECYCGKYRRIRYKGLFATDAASKLLLRCRRERMGHIKLAVASFPYLVFTRSAVKNWSVFGYFISKLGKSYLFCRYIVTKVDEEAEEARVLRRN